MSHGRIVVLSNMELSQHERELALDYLRRKLCPHKYDYIREIKDPEDRQHDLDTFFAMTKIGQRDKTVSFSFRDAFNISSEEDLFPEPNESPIENYIKTYAFFYSRWNLFDYAFVRKYGEDDIEVTHVYSLLDGILETEISYKDLADGYHPDWDTTYEYILTDIYDYHY